jgi:4-diphosphocytidyl-2-C-methyl-D-erythritol kinase
MVSITELAPAKVNLALHILGKRPDGYHELVTLFEKIDILDRITVTKAREGISISSNSKDIPRDGRNICHKAAAMVMERYGVTAGVRVKIDKKIPVAAGLGGGSSDAAATIRALDRLWGLKMPGPEKAAIAAELGSDVAFFMSKAPFAIGKGRGEKIKERYPGWELWHLVIYPNIKLLTSDIYRKYSSGGCLALTKGRRVDTIQTPKKLGYNMGGVRRLLRNDLEDVVLTEKPILKDIKENLLRAGALGALVSGSGSSVFGLFGSQYDAKRACASIRRRFSRFKGWRLFVARTYSI